MSDLTGIATWNYREGSLAERIVRFARMGYNAVSLSAGDACALCRGSAPDVDKAIAEHDLAVAFHASFMEAGAPIPPERLLDEFDSYVRWNERTGALHTVNYDAAMVKSETGEVEYNAEFMRPLLRKMLSMSNGAGFSVGVEDWPRNREQFEDVSELTAYSHYGILIDLGHLNMRIREPDDADEFPVDAARRYLDRITLPINELHVHNNDGLKDRHAPPESGTADMAALAQMLRRKGARCISTIEIVPAWCGLNEQQGWDAAKRALEFWREVF